MWCRVLSWLAVAAQQRVAVVARAILPWWHWHRDSSEHVRGSWHATIVELAASSTSLLSNDFVAIGLENQEINNQVCSVVKVIPIDIESTIVAGQFWINKNSEVCKMTFITKDKGSYTANLFYDNNPYKLPSKAIVTFDVKDQKLPALLTGDLEGYSTDEEFNEVSKGKIEINYFNYSIN